MFKFDRFFLLLSLLLLQLLPLSSASVHFKAVSTNKFLAKTTEVQTVTESSSSDSTISGPIIGSILFIFSLVLLWYNEKGYVTTCHRLKEELIECADLDPYTLSTQYNGHLVYLKSTTSCDENLKDNQFLAFGAFNAVKLLRTVEMYQWKEERHERDHHVHYDYKEVWDETFIDSNGFHEQHRKNNSKDFIVRSEKIIAKEVHIGCYMLSEELKEMAKNKTEIVPTEEMTRSAVEKIHHDMKELGKEFKIQDGHIYVCKDKFGTNNGDLRIKFFEVKCGPTTIVGQLEGTSFIKHQIESALRERTGGNSDEVWDESRGCCENCCSALCKLASKLTAPISEILWIFEKDIATKEDVFEEVTREHKNKRNLYRVVGWVLSWLGIWIFFGPIVYLLSVFPLIGGLLATLASWAALLFGLIVGTVLSVLVISIAWLFYRPLISLGLILISVGLGVGLCYA